MKTTLLFIVIALATAVAFSSCAASKNYRGGCKMSMGMVGYR